ncbi:phosphatase PAP2 family protein [Prolixibacteraceae bacterium Z1-6]|uniref:Phosphatase PAP2 family protein n=1 Tax=Draconibacterium aestuarii TaxID=2998507 RepID=A0A9X3F208_9BACT|nr:phosphatase PAP2 family protein [Prolixibacteraceae bacterium Z1-6]
MIKQICYRNTLLGILLILWGGTATASSPKKEKNLFPLSETSNTCYFHNDPIHRLNFRYHDKQRGIKPFIAPTLLIAGGTALHFSDVKYNIREWADDHFSYAGKVDDYIRYAPALAVYSLNALGVKGKNNFGNRTILLLKSLILNNTVVYSLKKWTDVERPNGGEHSFPSGHTSVAFTMAHFMHKEYGEVSPWYSVGAYSCATAVGVLRIAKGAHWLSDVVAGAGFGMLSTELVYLTHLYKWDNKHLKNFDIFPFQTQKQKGLTLVCKF